MREVNNVFNWTATYRWDSTLVTPYAKFAENSPASPPPPPSGPAAPPPARFAYPHPHHHSSEYSSPPMNTRRMGAVNGTRWGVRWAKRKRKGVAWFVSNCSPKNDRNEFVQKLKVI